jgi:multiple sugar transport system substrate-binding protein
MVDAFNASQDEIEVEWVVAPKKSDDVRQQMLTSLAAGSDEYDVLQMDCCWVADIAASGYLEPIDTYMMDAGLNIADFNAGAIQANTYSAKLYALPLYPDTASLYVRNDIVSEEDLATLVSGDYSYRDLMDMAAKYAGEGGTTYGLAVQANQYEGLICNVNEWTSNFTNLEEGLANFKEAVTADYTSDKQLSMVESDGIDLSTSGQVVMYRGWSSTYGNYTDETAVHPDQITVACLPNEGGSCLGGWEMGININSEKKDAAWKFIQYATSGEGNIIYCTTAGNIPGYTPNTVDEDVLAVHPTLSTDGVQNSLKITISRPAVARYSELSDSLQVAIHSYLSDEAELDETVATVQSLLDEYGYEAE